ncbi:MAG: D-2-hydroxyacid dehydrogenase [Clostridia bacterium]
MKIVVLDGYTENPGDLSWVEMERYGEVTVYDFTEPTQIVTRMQGADVVYTNKTPITRETLAKTPSVQMISVLATGYNVVDVAAAREKGIPVCNVPTYGTAAVAQYVFALLLEVCHHVAHHGEAVQQGRWTAGRDFCFWDFPLMELAGKTMGIIGYGRIGRATAQIARAFGMTVLAYDAHVSAPECVPLDELLAKSDVVSLHCPLLVDTERLICKETIAKMKDGVILINTSRGPLIDEGALREALLSGKVYAAAVDVVSKEPITAENPLLGLPNCLITPHIAWAPKESRQRLMDVAVENLRAFAAGKPVNVVNG